MQVVCTASAVDCHPTDGPPTNSGQREAMRGCFPWLLTLNLTDGGGLIQHCRQAILQDGLFL
jgi:hypothetical protein